MLRKIAIGVGSVFGLCLAVLIGMIVRTASDGTPSPLTSVAPPPPDSSSDSSSYLDAYAATSTDLNAATDFNAHAQTFNVVRACSVVR